MFEKNRHLKKVAQACGLGLLLSLAAAPPALALSDSFTTNSLSNPWSFTGTGSNDSCLTVTGSVRSCPAVSPGYTDVSGQGWLRLTSNAGTQYGTALLKQSFNLAQGFDLIFNYAIYPTDNATGAPADGMSVFLYDPSVANAGTGGATGGGLGYCGAAGGILGIGIDEWGNFPITGSNTPCGTTGLPGSAPLPGNISVRAGAKAPTPWKYLGGTGSMGPASIVTDSAWVHPATANCTAASCQRTGKRIHVSFYPDLTCGAGQYRILVQTVDDNSINQSFCVSQTDMGITNPDMNVQLGFSASTGGNSAFHEIRLVGATQLADLVVAKADPGLLYGRGSSDSYVLTVTNKGPADASDSILTATLPPGMDPATATVTCTPVTGGAVCPAGLTLAQLLAGVAIPTLQSSGSLKITITGTMLTSASGPQSATASIAPPSNSAATALGISSSGVGCSAAGSQFNAGTGICTATDTHSPMPMPTCTANPDTVIEGDPVSITCTGGTPGNQLTILGSNCANTIIPPSGILVCTGTAGAGADQISSDPSVTVTNPGTGLSSNDTVSLTVYTHPSLPVCTAVPNPVNQGNPVSITCTGGTPGDQLTIPGSDCTGATIPSSGTLVCSGTAGTGATDVHSNPSVTVTDHNNGLTSSGTVSLTVNTPPPAPTCTASPNPAPAGGTVTINCTGGNPGDSISIPGATCNPATFDGTGKATCTGTAGTGAGQVNSNPSVTVTDHNNGLTSSGTVLLTVNTTAPNPPVCAANPNPAASTDSVTITCTVDIGSSTTIPGAVCTPTPATGTTVTCTGTGASLGNNPPATSVDASGLSSTAPVPLQIKQGANTSMPPLVPVCTASPNSQASGKAVSITCVGGHPGDAIAIPGCTFNPATLDASGSASCTGVAGAGAGQVNNNPSVTVTDPGTQLSNSGTVPFQVTGSTTAPQLPVCTAKPDPAGAGTAVIITCVGGTPGASITIPGSSCDPATLDTSGNATCTGTGSGLGSNPPLTVTDDNGSSRGNVPLNVDSVPPNPPACTASPSPAAPTDSVTITCTVDAGSSTTIPGALCTPTPATGTTVTCTGTGASLGNNPPATSTDASGNNSNSTVPLVIKGGSGALAPPLPICTATPNPQASGKAVTITCTGGHAGDLVTIPGTSCHPTTLDASGGASCTGTAGTGAGQVNDNPSVTVTNPGTGLSSSGTVPFQIIGSGTPPLPTCTASPNPASEGRTVTITCTGGNPGDSITIPGSTDCNPGTFDGSGNATCTGKGSNLGNNPSVTVTNPNTGLTVSGKVPLTLTSGLGVGAGAGGAAQPVPTLGELAQALLVLLLAAGAAMGLRRRSAPR